MNMLSLVDIGFCYRAGVALDTRFRALCRSWIRPASCSIRKLAIVYRRECSSIYTKAVLHLAATAAAVMGLVGGGA